MLRLLSCCCLLLLGWTTTTTSAFVPSHTRLSHRHQTTTSIVARSLLIDPSVFHHHNLPQHIDSIRDAFSTLTLSDAVDTLTDAATSAAAQTSDAAATAAADAANSNGWFGFLTGPIEGLLQLIHTAFMAVGLNNDSWGVSIVALTVLIKLLTYPLTKSQLESTNKMQALQPTIKAIQEKYQSNQEVMNQKIAEVYQTNEVNPLAGCIPSLVQIPVFIGLYRAVLTLAKDDKLNEPFLWLPSLEGPTYGADPTHGSDWILSGWHDGIPSLGWGDTTAFLILPIFLVLSQYVSMELMQPKDGPQQNNFILKLLPLMIGWFSLNVPAALCIYWVTNNIITTATTLMIRNSMKVETVAPGGASAAAAVEQKSTIFAPPRQKPSGFSASTPVFRDDEVKPLTAVVDAEIVKSKKVDEDDDEDDDDDDDQVAGSKSESVTSTSSSAAGSGSGMDSAADKKGRAGDKKKKRRKRKA